MTIEDLTTYSKNDPNNRFTITASKAIATDIERGEAEYIYKDAGVGHFSGDFEHLVSVEVTGYIGYGQCMIWSLANVIDYDSTSARATNNLQVFLNQHDGLTDLCIREWYSGNIYGNTDYSGLSYGTEYYLTIARSGSTWTCKIYSDSARTSLITTLSITLQSIVAYQYFYAMRAMNGSGYPFNCFAENINLQEGPTPLTYSIDTLLTLPLTYSIDALLTLPPTVAIVGTNAKGYSFGGTTISVTMGQTPTEGNVIICAVGFCPNSGDAKTVHSITQTGVDWTFLKRENSIWVVEIWAGVVGSSAGTGITVTCDNISSVWGAVADAVEFSGLDTSSLLDKTASSYSNGSGTTLTGTTDTTTQADELCVGAIFVNQYAHTDALTTPTNGFTKLDGIHVGDGTYNISLGFLYKMVSAEAAYSSGLTNPNGGSDLYEGCIVTLKAASAPPPPTPLTYSIDTLEALRTTKTKPIDAVFKKRGIVVKGISTEQIVNGGFESGDFTGWLHDAGVISTSNPHSGTYCVQTDGDGALDIYQNFASLPLSSITSSSIWVSSDLEDNMGISFITDDEIGHYDFTLATDDSGTWTQFDLAALLSQEDNNGNVPLALDGNLTQIEVYILNATTLTAVDDVSLIAFKDGLLIDTILALPLTYSIDSALQKLGIIVNNANLVGLWHLDEGSGVTAYDSSGNGNDGTLYGSALPTWVAGRWGHALSFDGIDNNVIVPTLDGYMDGKSSGSICVWFNFSKTQAGAAIAGWWGGHNFNIHIDDVGTKISFHYCTTEELNNVITSSSAYNDGQWHFAVGTYDTVLGGILYIDGSVVDTLSANGTLVEDSTFALGSYAYTEEGPFGSFFNGLIDEVRAYSRALSQAEITALFNTNMDAGTHSIDAVFKMFNLSKTDLMDVILSFRFLRTEQIDTDIKKLGITKTNFIDIEFDKYGFKSRFLDVDFKKRNIPKIESADVILSLRISKTKRIDMLLKKLRIGKTNSMDAILASSTPPTPKYKFGETVWIPTDPENVKLQNALIAEGIAPSIDAFILDDPDSYIMRTNIAAIIPDSVTARSWIPCEPDETKMRVALIAYLESLT